MGTEAIIGIVSLILSATANAVGAVVSHQQAQAQVKLQAQQAQARASSLEEQAKQEEQDQLMRSQVERRQNARKLAAAEAGYAAAGVSLEGTPTLSLGRMSEEQELDVLMQEASSNRKRNLLLTEAWNTRKTGMASSSLSKSTGTGNLIGGLLSGASDTMRKTYNFSKKEGMW